MPKRKCRNLDGIRIEFNDRERDLLEQAIIGNTIGKVSQGLGTALGGMGLAAGILGGVFIFVGGISVFKDFFEKDRADWEAKHLTQEKYDAYINSRTTEWIAAAKKAGRYGPAVGDAAHTAWWSVLDPARGVAGQAMLPPRSIRSFVNGS